jgi:replicative DNA helicase
VAATSPNRTPPHDLQAEESLLGAMLLKKDAIAAAAERLNASDFYSTAHGHIFTAIVALDTNGAPVDPVTVADELRASGLLDKIGGPNRLVDLRVLCPATSNAGQYAKIIEDCAVLRRLIAAAGEIAETAYEGAHDVAATVDQAEASLFNVAHGRRTESTITDMTALFTSGLDRLEALYERGDKITGIPTGFDDLDELLGGLQKQALYVIGGRPSMGKTALALGMAAHAGLDVRTPTLVFSLEMGEFELFKRFVGSQARIDSKRLTNGNLTETDWSRIAKATEVFHGSPIEVVDNPHATLMEIRSKARRVKAKYGDLGAIVVDYMQLLEGDGANRQEAVAKISRGLKILAREMDCAVIALSQLSRQLESRMDKRPILADLRESGSVEQDADVVMFVYRDEVYRPDGPDKGVAEVIIAKHRNGPQGTVRLAWLDSYTKFANMARRAA